jgi:hypothetical protein
MQELATLEDAWQPGKAASAAAEAEERQLQATAAVTVAHRPLIDGTSSSSAGSGQPDKRPGLANPQTGGGGAGAGASSRGTAGSSRCPGGDDVITKLLSGQFGSSLTPCPPASAPTSRPPPPSTVPGHIPTPTAVSLAALREREVRAADIVRRLHSAAAMDATLPASEARTRLLPSIGAVVIDPGMAVSLLRAGVLGALRRVLQTTADASITTEGDSRRIRQSVFAMLRALAPSVQPAHLRASRGLGRLLMLVARSVSEPRTMRAAAGSVLEAMLPMKKDDEPGAAGPVELDTAALKVKREREGP